MALTATFAADLSQFSKSLAEAQVELQVFDRATRNATRGLTREIERFSGQQISVEAARMAEAVERVGGVSKLTEAEVARVAGVVDEFAGKMRVLGNEVPPNIAALQGELERLGTTNGKTAGLMAGFGKAAAALGPVLPIASVGAATMAVIGFAAASVKAAGDVLDLSNKLGVSSDFIQELRQVANQTGSTVEAFTDATFKLGINVSKGSEAARDAVKALGLSYEELKRQSPEEQYRRTIAGLEQVEVVTERNRLGQALFGKQWAEIAAAVAEGHTKIAQAARISSRAQLEALDEAGDAWQQLKDDVHAFSTGMMGDLLRFAKMARTGFDGFTDAQRQELAARLGAGEDVTQLIRDFEAANRAAQAAADSARAASTAGAAAAEDFVARLAAAQREAAQLRAGDTAQLDAALALNEQSLTDIADQFGVSEQALRLYQESTRKLAADLETGRRATEGFQAALAQLTGGEALRDAEEALRLLNAAGGPAAVLPSKMQALADTFQRAADAARHLGRTRVADEFARLATALRPALASTRTAGDFFAGLVAGVQDADSQIRALNGGSLHDLSSFTLPETAAATAAARVELEKFTRAGAMLAPTVQQVQPQITSLGESLQQGITEVAERIPNTIAQALVFGGSLKDAARSLASQLGAAIGKDVGASIGKSMGNEKLGGIIGGAVGSLAGLVVDAIASIGRTAGEDVMRRVGYDFGVQISEGLAEGIADESRRLFRGNRQAAELFNLGAIIEEGGGLSDRNIHRMTARLRDIFVMLDTGAFTTAQATEAMNESFGHFADYWTEQGGLVSRQMLEIIQLSRQMGVESQAVAEFVATQITGATNGLATFYQTGADAAEALAGHQARLAELQAELGRAGSADRARLEQEIAEVTRAIAQQQAVLEAVGVTTEQQALAAGAAIAAMVAQLQRDGMTIPAALAAVQPAVEALAAQLERAGLSGGAAFDDIRRLAGITSDEIAGPVLTAVSGLAGALEGLHNSGLLTQDVFAGLGSQMTQAFDALLGQGIAGDDALRLMQPTLQRLWQLQQDFGYEVDEATQALLDQAEAAGLVGDEQRDAQERAARAMEQVAERLGEIIDRLYGVEDAGKAAARGIDAAGRATDGLPAGSRASEAPAPTSTRAASAQAQAGARASGPPVRVEVPVNLDGYQVARVVVPHVPTASRRLGA